MAIDRLDQTNLTSGALAAARRRGRRSTALALAALAALSGACTIVGGSHGTSGSPGGGANPAATSSSGGNGAPEASELYCSATIGVERVCYGYSSLSADEQSAVSAACSTSLGGTLTSSCPSGAVGCCALPTAAYSTTQCYYTGQASALSEACIAQGGAWSGTNSGVGGADGGSPNPATDSGARTGGGEDASSGQDVGPFNGACTGGEVACPSGCADLQSDPNNCGSCEYACPLGSTCASGSCASPCGLVDGTYTISLTPTTPSATCAADSTTTTISAGDGGMPGNPSNECTTSSDCMTTCEVMTSGYTTTTTSTFIPSPNHTSATGTETSTTIAPDGGVLFSCSYDVSFTMQ